MFKFAIAGVALLMMPLAGCGGSAGSGPIKGQPATQRAGTPYTASYDPKTDSITLTFGNESVSLHRDLFRQVGSPGDAKAIIAYSDGTLNNGAVPTFIVYRIASATGDTWAEATSPTYNVTHNLGVNSKPSTTLARTTTTVLPTSGTATMNGAYIGMSGDLYGGTDYSIRGRVHLTADFADDTISGKITDRTAFNETRAEVNPTLINDVTLEAAKVNQGGVFAGKISGGEAQDLDAGNKTPYSSTSGTYGGLLSGPKGNEAAGVVTIIHDYSYLCCKRLETGIFVAE